MLQDVRYALRQFLKSPAFTIVAILTLALAIGSNVAIFSAVDAVLLHPLPYPHADRLVAVSEAFTHFNLLDIPASPPEVMEYKRMVTSFSELGYFATNGCCTVTGAGAPEPVFAMQISSSIFTMLGVTPVAGSLFSADAEKTGNEHVVVISTGLWKRRFASDPSIIGRDIELDRERYKILGVIRPILQYRAVADLWMPLAFTPKQIDPAQSLGSQFVDVIGRLKPGVSVDQSRAEFRTIAAAIERKYPDVYKPEFGHSLTVYPLIQKPGQPLKQPLYVLLAAVGAVMLIACANISNLLLARAMLRRKEISIRAALGAGRARVIRQLLTESLLLSLVGAAAGVALALYGLNLFTTFGPEGLIRGTQPAINLWVLAFSLALSIVSSVVFGLAPALATSRVDLHDALKEGARGSSGGRRILRESMVALEVATSLVLLIGAGLLIRSFMHLERADPGFRARNILTGVVILPVSEYKTDVAQREFARDFLDRIRALPGVETASSIDLMPFSNNYSASSFEIIDHPRSPTDPSPVVISSRINGDYFHAMGIPLLRGRAISASDSPSSLPVAVIDQTVAQKFFPTLDPIGQRISGPTNKVSYTVVGVAGAIKFRDLSTPPEPIIYYSSAQAPKPGMILAIKASVDPLSLVSAIRAQLSQIDPNLPLARVGTEEQRVAESLSSYRFSIQLMTLFAAIAAILAAIGIYGVLAYLIDQRRRELGIRIALGAHAADILGLVLRQGGLSIAIGLAGGLAAALGLSWFLKSLLYEVSATDPLIFFLVSIGLVIVALLAMSIPATRATRVDPVDALRQE
jgi:putative ABC transport system permease protein